MSRFRTFDLQFSLCDGMRGVKDVLEEERRVVASAIFERFKLFRCEVVSKRKKAASPPLRNAICTRATFLVRSDYSP
jgi:hypothetical protein